MHKWVGLLGNQVCMGKELRERGRRREDREMEAATESAEIKKGISGWWLGGLQAWRKRRRREGLGVDVDGCRAV